MRFFRKRKEYFGGGLIHEPVFGITATVPAGFSSPAYVDGRPYCIETSNQGTTSHCAGYATAGAKEIRHWRETGRRIQFDGDKCYETAKTLDGMPGADGTSLHAALQAARILGWFDDSTSYNIQTAWQLRWALHRYGCCVVGFDIDSNWSSVDKHGWIAQHANPEPRGGHAVLVCYYDKDGVGFQNSWGTDWGTKGFARMTWAQFNQQFMYGVTV